MLVGPPLAALFSDEPVERAGHRMTDALADRSHDVVVEYTPVDSGNLRTQWYRTLVRRVGGRRRRWETEVRNDSRYALWVEEPTGIYATGSPYEIRPRAGGVLSWISRKPFITKEGKLIPAGTRVFAKRVMHPGSKGAHMAKRTATTIEATADQIVRPAASLWVVDTERHVRSVPSVIR
jgi:hypothetical protein